MTVGTLALSCLWLTLGQAPAAEVNHFNQRNHKIPINLPPDGRANISEVRLFASPDQGRSWQQVGAVPPERDGFAFYAPRDGTYWLRAAQVDRQGRQVPEDVTSAKLETQVLVIDTQKPIIRTFEARPQGDEVILAWDIQEENPDGASFRIEYQPKGAAAWTPVQVGRPALAGQDKVRLTTGGPLTLRLTLRDLAGNQSLAFAEVNGGGAVVAAFSNPPAGAPAPVAVNPGPSSPPSLPTEIPVPATPVASARPEFPQVGSVTPPAPSAVAAKEPTIHQTLSQAPPELPGKVSVPTQAPPQPAQVDVAPRAVAPPRGALTPGNAVPPPGEKIVADSRTPPPSPVTAPAPKAVPTPDAPPGPGMAPLTTVSAKKPLPPLQYVNQPEVTLEFELSRVGPSGLKSIHLWCTLDDGVTWEEYAIDEKTEGISAGTRQRRKVPLAKDNAVREGIYGFRLGVMSKAGLCRPAPKPGDAPEMRVELDATPPLAQLIEPAADPGRPNTLLLKWNARDKNLGDAPVTLEWAEKRDGDWRPIGVDLPNDGKFSWPLPEKMPVQVYLRLRVRDLAGNESVAVTAEPQYVDLTEPEGHLVNVSLPRAGR